MFQFPLSLHSFVRVDLFDIVDILHHESFIYGGWKSNLGQVAIPYDEFFNLTLPTFHWLKVRYPLRIPDRHTFVTLLGIDK